MHLSKAQQLLSAECREIECILLARNAACGSSALQPLRRIFSKANPIEQIRVRLDDKLSRIARGQAAGEDVTLVDLIGYLVLLRVAGQLRARTRRPAHNQRQARPSRPKPLDFPHPQW